MSNLVRRSQGEDAPPGPWSGSSGNETDETEPAALQQAPDECYQMWQEWNDVECAGHTCGTGYKRNRYRSWNHDAPGASCSSFTHGTEYHTEPCEDANGNPFVSCSAGQTAYLEKNFHDILEALITSLGQSQ